MLTSTRQWTVDNLIEPRKRGDPRGQEEKEQEEQEREEVVPCLAQKPKVAVLKSTKHAMMAHRPKAQ
jgi:hypothetical protein